MSKSNAIQAEITAEMYINVYDVEILLNAITTYYETIPSPSNGTRHHCLHLYDKFNKLYNELKGGKNEQTLV